MCTVTIIPKGGNNFVLTSNRDETPNRVSLPPDFYKNKQTNVLYPKDTLSGGTWIGLSEKSRVVCMLNGAFSKHERQENYTKSRGLIALDFLTSDTVLTTVETYNLSNIEPFTMVIADWNDTLKFFELVWDGTKKQFTKLPLEPKIWSSSTLYNTQMKQERLQWFDFFKAENTLNAETVLKFHKTTAPNNKDYGVIMNRGFIKTTSITQIEKCHESVKMNHENLQNNTITSKIFHLSEVKND